MNIRRELDFKPCVPGAFRGGLLRTAFYDGMVLRAEDLLRDQSYWRMKRKLTNRALGQGVVWGLNLEWDEKTRCFTICPGYGISCCGDDLVLECPETVCEGDLIDPCSEDFRRLLAEKVDPCECDPKPDGPIEACLMLEYLECPEDPRQVYEDPCAEQPQGCRYGAMRETTRLRLVPPPREQESPIDRFCDKIARIRKALAEKCIDMPEASFPESQPGSAVSVTYLDENNLQLGGQRRAIASELDASIAFTSAPPVNMRAVRLNLEPQTGYFFVTSTHDGVESEGGQNLMQVSSTHQIAALTTAVSETIVVEVAPILGNSESLRIEYLLAVQRQDGAIAVRASVKAVERLPARSSCASLLADGLFLKGDARCTVRTLILALTCGWFKGAAAPAPCAEAGTAGPDPARLILAWGICWLAWRILFGIDMGKDDAANVEKCLRQLFVEWCDEFAYKGPRCENNQHGVILGCVQISPKGRILCFDEWKHRRYVLTGPLISHWGGLFGLAPLDVTAGRLASWICCVAKAELPQISKTQLASFEGILPISGGAVAFGKDYSSSPDIHGLPVSSSRQVNGAEFIAQTLGALATDRGEALSTARSVRLVSSSDLGMTLMLPASGIVRDELVNAGAVEAEIAADLVGVPAMARAPIKDFGFVLAQELPISVLKPASRSTLFDPMISALEVNDVNTIADLIIFGAEPAVERVRTELAESAEFAEPLAIEKAMGMVYDAAVATVRNAGNAIAKEAKAREPDAPFTRAELTENATISAIRKATNPHLRGRGLTSAEYRAIAAKAVAVRG